MKQKKDTLLFKQYIKEIERLLVLAQIGGDWYIDYDELDMDEDHPEVLAAVDWSVEEKWAEFLFSSKVHKENKMCPLESARHEFGHFVVCKLYDLAQARYTTYKELQIANEEIARIFERILKPKGTN